MNALFETDLMSSKRKETGARFRLNDIPMEFSSYNCFYENPVYGLDMGFLAILISEKFALKSKRSGRVVQQSVTTGAILEKGRLKATLEQKLGSSVPPSILEGIIHDIHELMAEFFINAFAASYNLREAGVKIQIYEAETRAFHHAFWDMPENIQPGPETIANLQAELVF